MRVRARLREGGHNNNGILLERPQLRTKKTLGDRALSMAVFFFLFTIKMLSGNKWDAKFILFGSRRVEIFTEFIPFGK